MDPLPCFFVLKNTIFYFSFYLPKIFLPKEIITSSLLCERCKSQAIKFMLQLESWSTQKNITYGLFFQCKDDNGEEKKGVLGLKMRENKLSHISDMLSIQEFYKRKYVRIEK